MTDLPSAQLDALLNQIADGDEQAFSTVYCHYQRFVYAYLRHKLVDPDAVEEVLHDTFLAFYRRPRSYATGQTRFSTWLCGIANHKLGDWARRRNRQPVTANTDDEFLESLPDPDYDSLGQLEQAEEERVLRDCLDALPADHRETFFWVFYEEEGMEQVAQRLACPVGTIKSRLHHARKRVAECVKLKLGAYR